MLAPAHETALEALEQEDAREPLPLPVRREQLRGLARLRPAAPERGQELDEREVVDEPGVVAAEALQRDDADRPRADTALAAESLEGVLAGSGARRGRARARAA